MFAPRLPRKGIETRCLYCRRHKSRDASKREPMFPYGFSATEPLVPPSADGSTPITDALPRSVLLDPTTYNPRRNMEPRQPPLMTIDSKNRTASALEQRLLHNPFARILASKPRVDRLGKRTLPRDLLLKFSIFRNPESEAKWVLPADITDAKVAGIYRLLSRRAIFELGNTTKKKDFLSLVPEGYPTSAKKHLVWREGMADHILMILRKNALDRLYSLPRGNVFQANVNDELTVAEVIEPAPPVKDFHGTSGRRRFANQFPKWRIERGLESIASSAADVSPHILNKAMGTEAVKGSPEGTLVQPAEYVSRGTKELGEIEDRSEPILVGQATDGDEPARSHEEPQSSYETSGKDPTSIPSETVTETARPTANTLAPAPPFISAILYLGPRHLRNDWEFKVVAIPNQALPTTLINMQRLFGDDAELHFFKCQASGNAFAIAASDISKNALWHALRLSFYIQGEKGLYLEDNVNEESMDGNARQEDMNTDAVESPRARQKLLV